MGLYRRGKIYWYSIMSDGRRVQALTKTDIKKLAEKIYSKAMTDIVEGRYFEHERAKSTLFKDLAERYMAKYQKQRDPYTVKHLLPYFGEMTLSDIRPELVEDYILSRAEEGAKPSTIYKEFALGRRMFNVARKRWKWITFNPFADIAFFELQEIRNERERWLTVEEEEVLLARATPDYLKDMVTFALHTGCRRGEILSVNWKANIDMGRRLVTVQASKNGNRKTIPMSNTLYSMLLKRSRVKHISGRVFPVEMFALKDAFERAVKKAGLDDFHFHDLRHTFATRLVQNGVDLYVVKSLMGHRSIKTTERYAHHYPESLRPSVKALDDCYRLLQFCYSQGEEVEISRTSPNNQAT